MELINQAILDVVNIVKDHAKQSSADPDQQWPVFYMAMQAAIKGLIECSEAVADSEWENRIGDV